MQIPKPMRIRSRKAINAARKPYCERCGRTDRRIEVHHLSARGMGAGKQMDVPENLISLCILCHRAAEDGHIAREELGAIVQRRNPQGT